MIQAPSELANQIDKLHQRLRSYWKLSQETVPVRLVFAEPRYVLRQSEHDVIVLILSGSQEASRVAVSKTERQPLVGDGIRHAMLQMLMQLDDCFTQLLQASSKLQAFRQGHLAVADALPDCELAKVGSHAKLVPFEQPTEAARQFYALLFTAQCCRPVLGDH